MITRRAFLRFAAALVAYAAQPAGALVNAASGGGELDTDATWQRGRAQFSLPVRAAPSYNGAVIKWLPPDSTFTILGAVMGDRPQSHNNVWYLIPGGFVHSAWVQPMAVYRPQPVELDIPEWGFWGEVFKPYTSARTAPYQGAEEKYRLYYGTVHHVIGVVSDPEKGSWYQIYDELPPTAAYWVKAHHIRKITPWEMRPIDPNKRLEEKQIHIDLAAQTVICYEGEQPVFFTRCASGSTFEYADGHIEDFTTPVGEFSVLLKQPSRHMRGGAEGEDDFFDLPGVPWNTFFTYSGIAIHGTFWHNDYGVQRSHGCVNVTPEAAKWIYRWSFPVAPYDNDYVQSDSSVGTSIIVV
ncbi:MAG: L,D-transpeptidase family protein [Anaerolineales bacterium]|nr:L,D-transpeptidase family protein [Anaerolineales bacterium]